MKRASMPGPGRAGQAGSGPQRVPDVGERGDRVGEEHHAEPADAQIEVPWREAVDLGIGLTVSNVVQTLLIAEPTGELEQSRGQIHA